MTIRKSDGYGLIAIDCDGTLLDDRMEVPTVNVEAVKYAQSKGVSVALCSGRSKKGIDPFAQTLGLGANDYIIAFNGGMIYKATENEPFYTRNFTLTEARERIAEINAIRDAHELRDTSELLVYHRVDAVLTEKLSKYSERSASASLIEAFVEPDILNAIDGDVYKILIVGERFALDIIRDTLLATERGDINTMFSAYHLLEVLPRDVLKGIGVAALAKTIGVSIENVIAVGDEANDLSMIETAGLGCAMKNGIEDVKTIADYVTENDNNHGGVAEVIRKFI